MGYWRRVWRVLKCDKGECEEFSTKARRGLEVIAILDQVGSLEEVLEQGNQVKGDAISCFNDIICNCVIY